MNNIITIALNPAYDLHYNIDKFVPYKENYVSGIRIEAGGKTVNISRVLHVNGTESIAYVVMGRDNCHDFTEQLGRDGLDYRAFYTEGRIRENITIHSEGIPETRISLDNFSINDKVLDDLYDDMSRIVTDKTIIAFCGKVPRGVTLASVINFLNKLKSLGAKIAVDSNSFKTEDLIEVKPWLIKPNEQEIQSFSDKPIENADDAIVIAKKLCGLGIENVIVSLGKAGAVYVNKDNAYECHVPDVKVVSTIGAGDSTVAGFIAAASEGKDAKECFATAQSYGCAACMSEGTLPPTPENIAYVRSEVEIIEK